MVSAKVDQLLDDLLSISVSDMAELVKKYMEATDIPMSMLSAAPAAAPVSADSAGADADVAKKKTVVLKAVGDKKVQLIKIVKDKIGVTLMQAKEMVEKENSVLKEDVSAEEAEELKKMLEEAGGTVELR